MPADTAKDRLMEKIDDNYGLDAFLIGVLAAFEFSASQHRQDVLS